MTEADSAAGGQLSLLPSDIAASWERSQAAGLRRTSDVAASSAGASSSSRLAVAAAPVLDAFELEIADSQLGVVLADRHARIVDFRLGNPNSRRSAAAVGLDVGVEFSEETSGTNAIATPAETGRPVFVDGDHHYLESLTGFSCFGLPIFHPVTKQVAGVIDLMARGGEFTPLMRPALYHVVHQIRERLIELSGRHERAMLDAFVSGASGRSSAVIAVGEGICLSNDYARSVLRPSDYAQLGELVVPAGVVERQNVVLESGAVAHVTAAGVVDGRGTLFTFDPGTRAVPIPRGGRAKINVAVHLRDEARKLRDLTGHVLVAGEPGSGRADVALMIPGSEPKVPVLRIAASEASAQWFASFSSGALLVEHADRLDEPAAAGLTQVMAQSSTRVFLTSTARLTTTSHGRALAAACAHRIDVPALRDRVDEIPALVAAIVREEGGTGSRLTLNALNVLVRHAWPDNMPELRAVVRAALATRPSGDIDVADLPAAYRSTDVAHDRWSPLELAEINTIRASLMRNRGNRTQAARDLMISRSTLYQKLRTYGLSA